MVLCVVVYWMELTHNGTQRHTRVVVQWWDHVARVQSLTIQTWMLCPSKPSVGSCSGAGVHGKAGTHIWTRQTHRLCHRETLDAPVVSIGTILDAQNYLRKWFIFYTIRTMTFSSNLVLNWRGRTQNTDDIWLSCGLLHIATKIWRNIKKCWRNIKKCSRSLGKAFENDQFLHDPHYDRF